MTPVLAAAIRDAILESVTAVLAQRKIEAHGLARELANNSAFGVIAIVEEILEAGVML